MGGVDKLDFLIYLYRINTKTNIDFSLANAKKNSTFNWMARKFHRVLDKG